MKEDLVRKFVERLDHSYNYKTVNERQNIINDLCEIAGIEQLTILNVVGRSEQLQPNEEINNDSLIGKKLIYKGREYTIIDKHNTSDFVLLDDDNMSMVGLHWEDVELVD